MLYHNSSTLKESFNANLICLIERESLNLFVRAEVPAAGASLKDYTLGVRIEMESGHIQFDANIFHNIEEFNIVIRRFPSFCRRCYENEVSKWN